MSDEISQAKTALRARMKELLQAQSAEEKTKAGRAVADHLDVVIDDGDTVAYFGSTALEIDTRPLEALLKKKRCRRLLPKVSGDRLVFIDVAARGFDDFAKDAKGLALVDGVAVGVDKADVVVVPGLAFDDVGGRTGYGKGFYDRALVAVKADAIVVAIGLDLQWLPAGERVPMDKDDRRVPYGCAPARGLREHG